MLDYEGRPVGRHYLVSKFMRTVYMYIKRPNIPKGNVVWDVNVVLSYLTKLGPAKTMPISMLTKQSCYAHGDSFRGWQTNLTLAGRVQYDYLFN